MDSESTTGVTRRVVLRSSAFVAVAGALAACGKAGSSSDSSNAPAVARPKDIKKVVFDFPNTQLPVYATVSGFAKERAKELGIELVLTNDNGKLDAQITNLSTLINQGAPAIVSFPLESSAIEPQAKIARAKGAIWVTYSGAIKNQDASMNFSFKKSGELLGTYAAEWATKNLGGKGKVAFLINDDLEATRLRGEGLIRTFTEGAPGVEVVSKQNPKDGAGALTVINAVLSKHPDLNMVLGVADDYSIGGQRALLARGRDPKDPKTFVGGMDGTKQALTSIKSGEIYRASSAVDLKAIGYAVIDVPLAIAKGSKKTEFNTAVTLLHEGSAELDEILAQQG